MISKRLVKIASRLAVRSEKLPVKKRSGDLMWVLQNPSPMQLMGLMKQADYDVRALISASSEYQFYWDASEAIHEWVKDRLNELGLDASKHSHGYVQKHVSLESYEEPSYEDDDPWADYVPSEGGSTSEITTFVGALKEDDEQVLATMGMKLQNLLEQGLVKASKGRSAGALNYNGLRIMENPSTGQLYQMMEKSDRKTLRLLKHEENLYAWDAYKATHEDVANNFLDIPLTAGFGYLERHREEPEGSIETEYSRGIDSSISGYLRDLEEKVRAWDLKFGSKKKVEGAGE